MAAIYNFETGYAITEGLQGCTVCDAALKTARRIAAERGEPVLLSDDDGEWIVSPDGTVEEHSAPAPRQHRTRAFSDACR